VGNGVSARNLKRKTRESGHFIFIEGRRLKKTSHKGGMASPREKRAVKGRRLVAEVGKFSAKKKRSGHTKTKGGKEVDKKDASRGGRGGGIFLKDSL